MNFVKTESSFDASKDAIKSVISTQLDRLSNAELRIKKEEIERIISKRCAQELPELIKSNHGLQESIKFSQSVQELPELMKLNEIKHEKSIHVDYDASFSSSNANPSRKSTEQCRKSSPVDDRIGDFDDCSMDSNETILWNDESKPETKPISSASETTSRNSNVIELDDSSCDSRDVEPEAHGGLLNDFWGDEDVEQEANGDVLNDLDECSIESAATVCLDVADVDIKPSPVEVRAFSMFNGNTHDQNIVPNRNDRRNPDKLIDIPRNSNGMAFDKHGEKSSAAISPACNRIVDAQRDPGAFWMFGDDSNIENEAKNHSFNDCSIDTLPRNDWKESKAVVKPIVERIFDCSPDVVDIDESTCFGDESEGIDDGDQPNHNSEVTISVSKEVVTPNPLSSRFKNKEANRDELSTNRDDENSKKSIISGSSIIEKKANRGEQTTIREDEYQPKKSTEMPGKRLRSRSMSAFSIEMQPKMKESRVVLVDIHREMQKQPAVMGEKEVNPTPPATTFAQKRLRSKSLDHRSKKIKVDHENQPDAIETLRSPPKNVDKTYFVQFPKTLICKLCPDLKIFTNIVPHYVQKHSIEGYEVFSSRLKEQTARKLLTGQSIKANECVFCRGRHTFSHTIWFLHFTQHTGEYIFECTKHGKVRTKDRCKRNNCKNVSGDEKLVEIQHRDIQATICTECHWIQLSEANVVHHVRTEHGKCSESDDEIKAKYCKRVTLHKHSNKADTVKRTDEKATARGPKKQSKRQAVSSAEAVGLMKESDLVGFGSVEESANTEGNVFSSKESEANVSKPVGDIAKGATKGIPSISKAATQKSSETNHQNLNASQDAEKQFQHPLRTDDGNDLGQNSQSNRIGPDNEPPVSISTHEKIQYLNMFLSVIENSSAQTQKSQERSLRARTLSTVSAQSIGMETETVDAKVKEKSKERVPFSTKSPSDLQKKNQPQHAPEQSKANSSKMEPNDVVTSKHQPNQIGPNSNRVVSESNKMCSKPVQRGIECATAKSTLTQKPLALSELPIRFKPKVVPASASSAPEIADVKPKVTCAKSVDRSKELATPFPMTQIHQALKKPIPNVRESSKQKIGSCDGRDPMPKLRQIESNGKQGAKSNQNKIERRKSRWTPIEHESIVENPPIASLPATTFTRIRPTKPLTVTTALESKASELCKMLDDLKNELLPENPSEDSRCNERNVKMNEKATNEFGGNRCEKGVETMSEIIGDKREPMSKDAGNSNSLRVPNTKGGYVEIFSLGIPEEVQEAKNVLQGKAVSSQSHSAPTFSDHEKGSWNAHFPSKTSFKRADENLNKARDIKTSPRDIISFEPIKTLQAAGLSRHIGPKVIDEKMGCLNAPKVFNEKVSGEIDIETRRKDIKGEAIDSKREDAGKNETESERDVAKNKAIECKQKALENKKIESKRKTAEKFKLLEFSEDEQTERTANFLSIFKDRATNVFDCSRCGFVIKQRTTSREFINEVLVHFLMHRTIAKYFDCTRCHEQRLNILQAIAHFQQHHGDDYILLNTVSSSKKTVSCAFICSLCSEHCPTAAKFEKHSAKRHSDCSIDANISIQSSDFSPELVRTNLRYRREYKCAQTACETYCWTKDDIIAHHNQSHDGECLEFHMTAPSIHPLTADVTKALLEDRGKSVYSKIVYTCPHDGCGKLRFGTHEAVLVHSKVHLNKKLFRFSCERLLRCPHCETIGTLDMIVTHFRQNHANLKLKTITTLDPIDGSRCGVCDYRIDDRFVDHYRREHFNHDSTKSLSDELLRCLNPNDSQVKCFLVDCCREAEFEREATSTVLDHISWCRETKTIDEALEYIEVVFENGFAVNLKHLMKTRVGKEIRISFGGALEPMKSLKMGQIVGKISGKANEVKHSKKIITSLREINDAALEAVKKRILYSYWTDQRGLTVKTTKNSTPILVENLKHLQRIINSS